METFGISINLQPRKEKIEWEFQKVCLECEDYFGKSKAIWTLPFKKNCTENLLRYALKECKTRQKPFLKYFLKIVNNQLHDKQRKKTQQMEKILDI